MYDCIQERNKADTINKFNDCVILSFLSLSFLNENTSVIILQI